MGTDGGCQLHRDTENQFDNVRASPAKGEARSPRFAGEAGQRRHGKPNPYDDLISKLINIKITQTKPWSLYGEVINA